MYKNRDFLYQKYVVEEWSAKQIGIEIFSSRMAVLDGLKKFGIRIRKPHHHHGRPSQPRFGQKFHRQELKESVVEQRVIRIVKDLHSDGLSLRQIARILNDMKVATKCSSNGWHPEMIRRVLGFKAQN